MSGVANHAARLSTQTNRHARLNQVVDALENKVRAHGEKVLSLAEARFLRLYELLSRFGLFQSEDPATDPNYRKRWQQLRGQDIARLVKARDALRRVSTKSLPEGIITRKLVRAVELSFVRTLPRARMNRQEQLDAAMGIREVARKVFDEGIAMQKHRFDDETGEFALADTVGPFKTLKETYQHFNVYIPEMDDDKG